MKNLFLFAVIISLFSCSDKIQHYPLIKVNQSMLDSIQAKSDTTYSKHYRNEDFVTAEYFINRRDSTVCQLMKDSSGVTRQILIAKNNRKLYSAEYFKNGHLVAFLPMGNDGKYNGASTWYYESGAVKSRGLYALGFHVGSWFNYDEEGNLISADEYNDKGELIKTFKK